MRYLSSLSVACFRIPTASHKGFCQGSFHRYDSLLRPDVTVERLHSSSQCLLHVTGSNCLSHISLFNAMSTYTTVPEHCIPDLMAVFICVWFSGHLVHLYGILQDSQTTCSIQSFFMPHTKVLATFPQLKQILHPSTFWK